MVAVVSRFYLEGRRRDFVCWSCDGVALKLDEADCFGEGLFRFGQLFVCDDENVSDVRGGSKETVDWVNI